MNDIQTLQMSAYNAMLAYIEKASPSSEFNIYLREFKQLFDQIMVKENVIVRDIDRQYPYTYRWNYDGKLERIYKEQ